MRVDSRLYGGIYCGGVVDKRLLSVGYSLHKRMFEIKEVPSRCIAAAAFNVEAEEL